MKRAVIAAVLFVPWLAAQTPTQLKYECTPEDIDVFGLTCTEEEPCPVFLELSSAESVGSRIIAIGNLHTRNSTLFGILLASDDSGLTWTEPTMRIRNTALEQVEFFDPLTGWASGESVDPLSRNPFFLLTTDGGKTWRQKLLFDDTKYGVISQFHFNSKASGELVLDASQGKRVRNELYASETGGESWELKQTSATPLRLSRPRAQNWRARADAPSNTLRLERANGRSWDLVASFAIHVSDCRPR